MSTRTVTNFGACLVEQEPRAGFGLYEDGEFVGHVQTTSTNARTLARIRLELERLFVAYDWPVWKVLRLICQAPGHAPRSRRGVGLVWNGDSAARRAIRILTHNAETACAAFTDVDRADLQNGRHFYETLDRLDARGVDTREARGLLVAFHLGV